MSPTPVLLPYTTTYTIKPIPVDRLPRPTTEAMKKLYRTGSVHPSPPIKTDHLSFLSAALSPEDRHVLAYLLSADPHRNLAADHRPVFHCSCFSCYVSYWARWDSSPNRHVIHHIIDAVEASMPHKKSRKKRAVKSKPRSGSATPDQKLADLKRESLGESRLVEEIDGGEEAEGSEKGSVRRMVAFIGEKIWGVWAN